jgi:hypothetical protein
MMEIETSIAPVCCCDAEAFASSDASASCYRCPEDVGIVAIVESERELREIERQIFLAYVMVGTHDSTLQQRPERFDVVGMNKAAHILAATVRVHLSRPVRLSC